MAQSPWIVLEDIPIHGKEAARLAFRCARDLNRHLGKAQTWNNLITQIATFSQSVIDVSMSVDRLSHMAQVNPSLSVSSKRQEKRESEKNKKEKISHNANSVVQKEGTRTFSRIKARGTVQLHPCFLNDVDQGARVFLSNFLLKYVPEFEGIWVAFHPNIVATEHVGFVSEAEPFAIISFQVELQCLVFRPKPGAILAGIVKSIRPTHIVLMVHGLFNACVRKAGLDRRYEFQNHRYVSKDKLFAAIELGSVLAFKVYRYHQSHSGDLMTIEGTTIDRKLCGVLNNDTLELVRLEEQQQPTNTSTMTPKVSPSSGPVKARKAPKLGRSPLAVKLEEDP